MNRLKPWVSDNAPPPWYTGVGSRKTPNDVLKLMSAISAGLCKLGWILRSGGADGADAAFVRPLVDRAAEVADIFLPFPYFGDWSYDQASIASNAPTTKAHDIASELHPLWTKLGTVARALHARNVHCVLGEDCKSPSAFVLCWTPDGAVAGHETKVETGGTGQAIRVATAYDVPVYNLQRSDHRALWTEFVVWEVEQ